MIAARTPTSYAILGLLSVRPWTTYELAKQVRRSLNWFWPRAERKLYDQPKRLVEQGLATATREQTGQRPRTVYEITDAGRAALREWLSEPPCPPALEFEGMVKVFFADAGSLDQLVGTLCRIEEEARRRLAALSSLAATRPARFPQRVHLSALALRLQYEQEDATLRWASWARTRIAGWKTAADPAGWDYQEVLDELAAGKVRSLPPG